MATKIRLQRFGKKGYPFYHIVVADSRAKRDGRYIEKLGSYNPNTNPATIDINFDDTLNWVQVGAEMSDTARAILSYKGILYKNHLLKGVKKGALTEADVEKKFEAWMKDKDAKIAKKSEGLKSTAQKEAEARLAAEKAVSDARAKEIAAKNTPEPEVEETPEAEVKTEEAPKAEEAKAEEPKKEEEAPKAEAKEAEEAPKGEVKEEEAPEAKAAEETPKGEVKAEEEAPKKEEEPAKEAKEEESKDKSAE